MTGVQTCALPIFTSNNGALTLKGLPSIINTNISVVKTIVKFVNEFKPQEVVSSSVERKEFRSSVAGEIPRSKAGENKQNAANIISRVSQKIEKLRDIIKTGGVSWLHEHSLTDRKSTRLNSSHIPLSRMPSSA